MNEVTISPQQKFEESIKDRIRSDIGDLIPDEVLAGLVEKAIQSMFFTKKETSSYGTKTVYPSWFEEEVERSIKAKIGETVTKYFEDNGESISESVATELTSSMPKILADWMVSTISGKVWNFTYNLESRLVNKLQR